MTDAKLFGTDSLTVMARAALMGGSSPKGPFAVAVDARRGMLYFGLYDEAGRKLDGPLLIAPDDAATRLPESASTLAVGSGAQPLAEAAAAQGRHHRARASRAAAERRGARRDRARKRRDRRPLCVRSICGRPTPSRKRKRSGGADAGRRCTVHRALPADAGLMAAIHASCFAGPRTGLGTRAAMAQFIASPGVLCLIGAVDACGGGARPGS